MVKREKEREKQRETNRDKQRGKEERNFSYFLFKFIIGSNISEMNYHVLHSNAQHTNKRENLEEITQT